jgi:cellulose synthase/poly-beta-1,6-N-acetylglucosamine synthase-like glycosyltransferase
MTLKRILELDEPITTTVSTDICVVIPAHNEELLVERCVRSVLAAGIPAQHVYVVDDGSKDATATVVSGIAGINLLTNDTARGKLGALQTAISHFELTTRYRYLALLDADSHVDPAYFSEVLARFAGNPETVLVCGAPCSERHNWLTAYRALEYAVTLSVFRSGQSALGVITVAPGCASTYATRILPDLEWDTQTLVEDMDLTMQIHRKRLGAMTFTPHALAHTQDPQTIRQYIGQLTRWYSGTWQVMLLRRLPFGGQRIDAEFAVLTGEGLIYSLLFLALPVLGWLNPSAVLAFLSIDQAMWLALAVGFSIRQRRADVLCAFPLFLFVRCLNCIVLLRTFWLEVIRRKTRREWFSVTRYRSTADAAVMETTHG